MGDAVISYTYGSGGARKSMTYPSGRVVSYSLGDTGKAIQLSGTFAGGGTAYASAMQYAPSGAVLSTNLAGGSLLEKRTYNELGQATQIEVNRGLQLIHRLGYLYPAVGNNGNVSSHNIATPQRTWNQYFGYDSANRLRLAMERSGGAPADPNTGTCAGTQGTWTGGEWCQRFGFDGFGNVWSAENFEATPLVANNSSWYVGSTNRYLLNGLNGGYDGAGNQTQLQVNDPQMVTDYDGEGRVLRRRNTQLGTTLFEYGYGGGGQRVRKLVGTVATRYVYGADGELVAEYGATGTSGSASPEYVLTDGLGSTRTKTNGVGLPLARFDYEPFGAEIVRNGSGGDRLRQRFTGKERDAETGLDYFGARYMSGAQGRFTSADKPFADQHPSDPQSWNLYSYVRNNPLKNRDPNGQVCIWGIGNTCIETPAATAAQGSAAGTGAQLLNDGVRRGQYQQAASQLSGPGGSAARKALQSDTYGKLSPIGKGLTDAAKAARAGQLAGKTAEQLAQSASTTSGTWNTIGSASKTVGALGVVVGVGMAASNIASAPEGQRGQVVAGEVGSLGGGLAGGYGGAWLGGAIGSLIAPGPGTAIGAFIGALGGGASGSLLGEKASTEFYKKVEDQ